MKVQIYHFGQNVVNGELVQSLTPEYLGYAEIENFDADEIWHLCNWSHWSDEKPNNLYANIDSCNHGLCLINPKDSQRWLALSSGWLVGNDEKITDYVSENRYKIIWL